MEGEGETPEPAFMMPLSTADALLAVIVALLLLMRRALCPRPKLVLTEGGTQSCILDKGMAMDLCVKALVLAFGCIQLARAGGYPEDGSVLQGVRGVALTTSVMCVISVSLHATTYSAELAACEVHPIGHSAEAARVAAAEKAKAQALITSLEERAQLQERAITRAEAALAASERANERAAITAEGALGVLERANAHLEAQLRSSQAEAARLHTGAAAQHEQFVQELGRVLRLGDAFALDSRRVVRAMNVLCAYVANHRQLMNSSSQAGLLTEQLSQELARLLRAARGSPQIACSGPFSLLPDDVIVRTLTHLDAASLYRMRQVCQVTASWVNSALCRSSTLSNLVSRARQAVEVPLMVPHTPRLPMVTVGAPQTPPSLLQQLIRERVPEAGQFDTSSDEEDYASLTQHSEVPDQGQPDHGTTAPSM